MVEIERKYLVKPQVLNWITNQQGEYIVQAYLPCQPSPVVRIRRKGLKAFLTIKGALTGISRAEFEYEIPLSDFEMMLDLWDLPRVEKTRYIINYAGKQWEIDYFHGMNEGLILAEIELSTEKEAFELPPWLEQEVTQDKRYLNQQLALKPFGSWKT